MKIQVKIGVIMSDVERLVLTGICAAINDCGAAVILFALSWWCWPSGVDVAFSWEVVWVSVRYIFGLLFFLSGVCEMINALIASSPYLRFARWIRRNEVEIGQLSLFPHGSHELQIPLSKSVIEGTQEMFVDLVTKVIDPNTVAAYAHLQAEELEVRRPVG